MQLKNGTYNVYELGENGEKLWTKMPYFKEKHIPLLIQYAGDTTKVTPCGHFPVNPLSSIPPYRIHDGKLCIMIAEYLLWCVEGIIAKSTFASLTPILINSNYIDDERLDGTEIIEVKNLYQNWWIEYVKTGDTEKPPLKGTVYKWR